jgi:uncharacterized protein YjbJ (UPF0337 family)
MAQSVALPNAEQLAGSWNQIKGKVREKWGQLSENDLEKFKGDVEQLVGHIQQKTGQTRQDIEAFVAEISAGTSGVLQKARDAATEYTGRAVESVQEQYEQVAEKVGETYTAAQDMVKRKPVESLSAAFGMGVLCGALLTLVLRSR